MKWINHQISTGFIVFAATDDALFVASSIVGAVLPDKLEGSPPKDSKAYWKWRKNHRTWSHYPVMYLFLIGLLQYAKIYYPDAAVELIANVLTYALVGALLHIAEDGVCGRVPIFTPHGKHGLKIFKVGSFGEYIFVILLIAVCFFVRFGDSEIFNEFLKNFSINI